MTEIPVIFCFDDRILLGAGVSILSLIDAAAKETQYDIRVLHPGLPADSVKAFQELINNTRHCISFVEIPSSRFTNVPKNKGSWTEIVYYRLLASEFLPDCDRAIYSDVDVFFKQDLSAAYEVELYGAEWAGVAAEENSPKNTMHRHFPENTKEMIYFSGFMVMDLKAMRTNNAIERYFETIKRFKDRLKFFDLDVLNIATPSICRLPFNYVVLEDVFETEQLQAAKDYTYLKTVYSDAELERAREAPAIIHYAGRRGKPWQRQKNPQFYQEVVNRLPARLKRPTFRDWRKKWLSGKGRRKNYLRSEV